MSLGTLLFAVADSYAVAFAGRAAMGLGGAVIYIAILRYGVDWFRPGEFATLNGLTVGVSGLGGIVATYPLAVAAAAFGWRDALVGLGVVGFVVAVAVAAVVRDTPEDAGLPPISGVASSSPVTLADVRQNVRRVVVSPTVWLGGTALFVSVGVNTTLLGLWGIPYLVQIHGLSVTAASTYTLVGSVGLVLGSPVMGWVSDRVGHRATLMIAGTALYSALLVALAAVPSMPPVVVGGVLFCTSFLGGAFILSYAVVKEAHTTNASGVATGAANSLGFLGAAVFPTVMGFALDTYWTGETVAGTRVYTLFGYRVAFAVSAGAGLVALGCALALYYLADGEAGDDADATAGA